MKNCTTISGVIEGKPGASHKSNEMNKAPTFNQPNNQGYNNYMNNQQRANTFSSPYKNNNKLQIFSYPI